MIVIHHNPDCGTFRSVLALIEASGERPVVIDYLKEGLNPAPAPSFARCHRPDTAPGPARDQVARQRARST